MSGPTQEWLRELRCKRGKAIKRRLIGLCHDEGYATDSKIAEVLKKVGEGNYEFSYGWLDRVEKEGFEISGTRRLMFSNIDGSHNYHVWVQDTSREAKRYGQNH